MIAEDGGSGNDKTLYWPYGFGFGSLKAIAGPIWVFFFSSEHAAPSVICFAAPLFALVPGMIEARPGLQHASCILPILGAQHSFNRRDTATPPRLTKSPLAA